jgi:hypothetical protein
LIEPSDNPISTSLPNPNPKNALQRVTNYKQEQPLVIDPNTILLHNSLITTNYFRNPFRGFMVQQVTFLKVT